MFVAARIPDPAIRFIGVVDGRLPAKIDLEFVIQLSNFRVTGSADPANRA
jgi:hypothetical protein